MTMALGDQMVGDSRWLKFRDQYTTQEHLMCVYDAVRGNAAVTAAGLHMVHEDLQGIGQGLAAGFEGMQWSLEGMSDQLAGLQDEVRDGFRGMNELISWGLARLCWEHEQDREIYRQMLHVLENPLETQSLELRRRAERAVRNQRWEEAANDLREAIRNNPYDYLAHLQLARISFFEFGHWEAAVQEAGLAARFADSRDADDRQKYYAALAYCHLSLLWRMDDEADPERRPSSRQKAYEASIRARMLQPNMGLAFCEQVVNAIALGKELEAWSTIDSRLSEDEGSLLSLEQSPDLRAAPLVQEFVERWKDSHCQYLSLVSELDHRVSLLADAAARGPDETHSTDNRSSAAGPRRSPRGAPGDRASHASGRSWAESGTPGALPKRELRQALDTGRQGLREAARRRALRVKEVSAACEEASSFLAGWNRRLEELTSQYAELGSMRAVCYVVGTLALMGVWLWVWSLHVSPPQPGMALFGAAVTIVSFFGAASLGNAAWPWQLRQDLGIARDQRDKSMKLVAHREAQAKAVRLWDERLRQEERALEAEIDTLDKAIAGLHCPAEERG